MSALRGQHFSWQRSSRTTDTSLPSTLADNPDAALYDSLRDAERQLDWTMARKVMEVQDSLNKNFRRRRTLRVYVSHTAHNQAWQTSDEESALVDFETGKGIPSWELKVEGKLLPPAQPDETNSSALPPPPPRKFSTLLKSMIIELDRDPRIYPEDSIIEWHRNPALPAEDGFNLRRRGDFTIRVRILLHLDHVPERCGVASPLAEILGVKQGSRMEIISALYQYIKLHGLQDRSDRRVVKCDDALRRTGLPDQFSFQDIPNLIYRYLQTPEPVVIFHTITIDPSTPPSESVKAYDVDVDLDDVEYKGRMRDVLTRLAPSTPGSSGSSRIEKLDLEIAETAQQIRSAQLRKQFFERFSSDPQSFISQWLSSQSRDLETILGNERGVPDELMRRSDFFHLPWVEEAVAVHEGMRMAGMLPPYTTPTQNQAAAR